MTQPDAEIRGSWLHRVRERIRGGRRNDNEARATRLRKRMHPERIGELKRQDKGDTHDPMSGVGGSWEVGPRRVRSLHRSLPRRGRRTSVAVVVAR